MYTKYLPAVVTLVMPFYLWAVCLVLANKLMIYGARAWFVLQAKTKMSFSLRNIQ